MSESLCSAFLTSTTLIHLILSQKAKLKGQQCRAAVAHLIPCTDQVGPDKSLSSHNCPKPTRIECATLNPVNSPQQPPSPTPVCYSCKYACISTIKATVKTASDTNKVLPLWLAEAWSWGIKEHEERPEKDVLPQDFRKYLSLALFFLPSYLSFFHPSFLSFFLSPLESAHRSFSFSGSAKRWTYNELHSCCFTLKDKKTPTPNIEHSRIQSCNLKQV